MSCRRTRNVTVTNVNCMNLPDLENLAQDVADCLNGGTDATDLAHARVLQEAIWPRLAAASIPVPYMCVHGGRAGNCPELAMVRTWNTKCPVDTCRAHTAFAI